MVSQLFSECCEPSIIYMVPTSSTNFLFVSDLFILWSFQWWLCSRVGSITL